MRWGSTNFSLGVDGADAVCIALFAAQDHIARVHVSSDHSSCAQWALMDATEARNHFGVICVTDNHLA